MENKEDKYSHYLKDIEKKERSSVRRSIILSSLSVLIAVFLIYFSLQSLKEKNTTIESQSTEIMAKNTELMTKDTIYEELRQDVLETFHELTDSSGNRLDSATMQKIRKTEEKISKLPKIIFEGNETVVRYYERKNDDPRIKEIINQLGFYLNRRPLERKDSDLENTVNTISFGDSVKLEEVERLAKELIKTTNSFRELVNWDLPRALKWKNKAIEIGYERRYENNPVLTNQAIEEKLNRIRKARERQAMAVKSS